ncbi:uncharacterized protein LOC111437847 [Cucurbita moschata]|uniref:Uncharacterized protein LOC111437847 n=1 Tax=Cucurbita moschata TaxID=3662 RepID=A0A6J1EUY5_CUCMO|nr:uncharacterized protein LOC111437847 [Cucurbita moschata]
MKLKYQGNARVKRAQLRLHRTFETLKMKARVGVSEYFSRVMSTANDMRNCGEDMPDVKIASLLVDEQKVIDKRSEEQVLQVENVPRYGQGRGKGTLQRGRGYTRGWGRGRSFVNRSAINCFRCGKQGHYQFECPDLKKEAVNYAEFDKEEELLLMAYTEKSKVEKEGIWFLDSGCSNHMTGDKTWFVELDESFKHTVRVGNSSKLTVEGRGSVRFEVEGQLQDKHLVIFIKEGTCKIYHQQRGLIMNTQMMANRMFSVHAKMKSLVDKCLKIEDEDLEVQNVAMEVAKVEEIKEKEVTCDSKKKLEKEVRRRCS